MQNTFLGKLAYYPIFKFWLVKGFLCPSYYCDNLIYDCTINTIISNRVPHRIEQSTSTVHISVIYLGVYMISLSFVFLLLMVILHIYKTTDHYTPNIPACTVQLL